MLHWNDMTVVALASAFALMGIAALAKPTLVTRQFGIRGLEAAGRSEVRAVYGGFGLATSGALLLALRSPLLHAGICLTVGVALAGMALGRVVSWALDHRIEPAPLLYLALELLGAAALISAASATGAP